MFGKAFLENLYVQALDDTSKYNIRRTRLHVAIMSNDATTFGALMNNPNLNVNTKDEFGRTPLHTAAMFGRYDMANALWLRGARSNIRDGDGFTPLHNAVNPIALELTPNHVKIAQNILQKDASPSMQSRSGFTPLVYMGKYLNAEAISPERASLMYQLAILLINYGAKPDEKAINITEPDRKLRWFDTNQLEVDEENALTWALHLNLEPIVEQFMRHMPFGEEAINQTVNHLQELSIECGGKRQCRRDDASDGASNEYKPSL